VHSPSCARAVLDSVSGRRLGRVGRRRSRALHARAPALRGCRVAQCAESGKNRGDSRVKPAGIHKKEESSMLRRLMLLLGATAVGLAVNACSSSSSPAASAPPKTPTPGLYSRLNPDIVEETPTSFVQRFKKDSVMKVDDKHIRNPIIGPKLE